MSGGLLELEVEGALAWIRIGREGARAPALTGALLAELDGILEEVEARASGGGLTALVLAGRGVDGWVVGSDLAALHRVGSAREGTELALAGQRVLRRLEQLPVPSVAAIEGACLGGGLELALAASLRIAADSPRTRLGLPEVRVGLIPGYGGTVRLPRLVGAQASLPLLLTGRPARAAEALRIGLVDELAPPRQFAARVERLAESLAAARRSRGRAWRRLPRRVLEDTAPGRRLVFLRAARRFLPPDDGNPAPRQALESVAEGLALPLDRAFRREARVFGRLLWSPVTRALIHAQVLSQQAARGAREPAAAIERAAVLGAGATGTALTYLLARAGVEVRVKDRKRSAMAAGVEEARARLGRETGRRGGPVEAWVEPATGFGGFGMLDLVVAAVGARPEAVRLALREAVEHTREECLLALASPAGPLAEAAGSAGAGGRLVGLHLAEPVERFPLLEIVTDGSVPRPSLDRLIELARRMGRVPVRAADRPGGVLPRLLGAYFAEALRLLDDGASPRGVDEAAERFGFTMGPFRRMDAVGVDRAVRGLIHLTGTLGERMSPTPLAERVAASGGTFYRYRKGRATEGSPELEGTGRAAGEPDGETVLERLVLALVNEAAWTEEAGTAGEATIDLASLAGLGFPRARGGILYHARQADPGALLDRFARLEERHGTRFTPASSLRGAAAPASAGHVPARVL